MSNPEPSDPEWSLSTGGRRPMPLWLSAMLLPLVVVWTLPQTIGGFAVALYRRFQGHRFYFYRFGPYLFLVVRAEGPASAGISLGTVIFADHHDILKHEFCHILSGMWLSWLYLPVYGLEYLIVGHSRSPHERVTCWFEQHLDWGWTIVPAPPELDPPVAD